MGGALRDRPAHYIKTVAVTDEHRLETSNQLNAVKITFPHPPTEKLRGVRGINASFVARQRGRIRWKLDA